MIQVSAPYVGDKYDAGWFDSLGKYYADTKNINEDGGYIGGVQEARVTPIAMGRILPKEDVEIIGKLTDGFGDGNSGFDLYEPLSQQYDLEEYCDEDNYDQDEDSYCAAIKKLFKKYPNGAKFVSNDIFGYDTFAPGSPPKNIFTELIEINPKYGIINISAPYINGDGYNAGWFDVSGKYYADIKNIDKDGNYIGGNA